MRTKVLLVVAALLMAIVSTVAIGSNMGFKISIPLTQGVNNFVSLPYYNGYLKAADVFADVGAGCTGVKTFDTATGTYITNTGSTTRNNFDIVPGTGYVITTSSPLQWIVVGSHNPALSISLTNGVNNFLSIPYHTTALKAADVFAQVGSNCTGVKRFDTATGTFITNTGSTTRNNFDIVPGTCYIVTVSSITTWTPSHY